MNKILIVSSNTYASGITSAADLSSLAAGSIAFLESNGTLINGATPNPTKQYMYAALGGSGDAYEQSNLLNREVLHVEKQSYVAPVAKVMFLGYDGVTATYSMRLPAVLIPGSTITVHIYNLDKEVYDNSRDIRVTYEVTAADTKATLMTNLVAAINAHTEAKLIVTAANTTSGTYYGMSLTSVASTTTGQYSNFTARVSGITNTADVLEYQKVNGVYNAGYTTATAWVKGQGLYLEVLGIETTFSVEKGNTLADNMGALLYKEASKTSSTATYTAWVVRNKQEKTDISQTNGMPFIETLIIVAETTLTGIIAIIDNVLGV